MGHVKLELSAVTYFVYCIEFMADEPPSIFPRPRGHVRLFNSDCGEVESSQSYLGSYPSAFRISLENGYEHMIDLLPIPDPANART